MMPLTELAGKTLPFRPMITDWHTHRVALSAIRRQVFIEEQHVPEPLEWDGEDEAARHFLVTDVQGNPVGCARLLAGGRLGRMAVLPAWRNCGIGRALLEFAIAECRRQGIAQVTLSAQTHAIGFYQKSGFAVCGGLYDDAGIPHRDMVLQLTP